MLGRFSKLAGMLPVMAIAAPWLGVPAFALVPVTGDEMTQMLLPIMGGLLALSVILVVVYIVLSKKKK